MKGVLYPLPTMRQQLVYGARLLNGLKSHLPPINVIWCFVSHQPTQSFYKKTLQVKSQKKSMQKKRTSFCVS